MARNDWSYLPVDKRLVSYVDQAVKSVREYGSKKYKSRSEFLVSAIQNQLATDGIKEKQKEVAAR